MSIIIIGSLNFDLVTFVNKAPQAGETIRANKFETHCGGKGLNQCIATAKLKDPKGQFVVKMVGNVGKDSFGDTLLNILKQHDVNVCNVGQLDNVPTGVATIIVEENNGQNRILIVAGANGKTEYTDKQLSLMFPDLNSNTMVVLQQEIPNSPGIMEWFKKERQNYQIVFNPSPFQPLDVKTWQLVDVLIVNEIESMQIIENVFDKTKYQELSDMIQTDFKEGYHEVCKLLQEHCVNPNTDSKVIITLGSHGVLFSSKHDSEVKFRPAITNVKVVDTTGAGDTFLGALVTQLYQDSSLEEAIEFSTKASSITIQHEGAAESIPRFKDIQPPFSK